MPAPEPSDWLRASLRISRASDREILDLLRQALKDVNAMLRSLARRESQMGGTFSDSVRRSQLELLRRTLLRDQAAIFTRLGDIVRARRLEAASRAVGLASAVDEALFVRAGFPEIARQLQIGVSRGLERTLEVALTRIQQSAVPLSERIYRVQVWMDGRLERKINSALARGLSAREFAAEAKDWFRPTTPGGIRYAALRLARTEINAAFHAMSVNQAVDAPWTTAMRWHLSSSHPKPDACDLLARNDHERLGPGTFKPGNVPRKPHPQCFCYVTPVTVDEDEFLDKLLDGRYNGYLRQQGAI